MERPERNIAAEYERQKAKLDLLAHELQIQKYEKDIESAKAEETALQDTTRAIEVSPQNLEVRKEPTQQSLWEWARCFGRKYMGGKSNRAAAEMRKQHAEMYQAHEKLFTTVKIIQDLSTSLLAEQNCFRRAQEAYNARWTGEEECFNRKSSQCSDVVDQVKRSEMELQAARQQIHEHYKDFKDIQTRLGMSNKALEVSKNEIEQLKPLYKVGLDARQRKYELDMKDIKDSRPEWYLVNQGNDAAHNGRALADATMFQEFCTGARGYRYPRKFEDQYNKVPAKVVWEHREFTIFHDILSRHMDMRQFGPAYKKPRFDTEFQVLFSKIYPSFEVASNEAVMKDPILLAAYRNLEFDHRDANAQLKAARRARRDS